MEFEVSTRTDEMKIVVESSCKFLARIYHALSNQNGEHNNLAMSSFSIYSVLALAYNGAKGSTREQMQEALGLPMEECIKYGFKNILANLKESNESFTMNVGNQIFVQKKYILLESFLEHATNYFLVKPESLDFRKSAEASDIINTWVEKHTQNKIRQIFSTEDINVDTKMVLVNAVYLKMKWNQPFMESKTKNMEFFLTPNQVVNTQLMHVKGEFKVCFIEELSCDVLDMPCKGNRFSMLFFLPKTHGDFQLMESNLFCANLERIDQTAAMTYEVIIPRFKLEATHDMNEHLKQLGMIDMFIEKTADFSGIACNRDIFVSKVSQKVFIEVNEEGCEAVAATAARFQEECRRHTYTFTCNRPFLFVIKDNTTGIILFNGRVMNPNPGGATCASDYNAFLKTMGAERRPVRMKYRRMKDEWDSD